MACSSAPMQRTRATIDTESNAIASVRRGRERHPWRRDNPLEEAEEMMRGHWAAGSSFGT